MIFFSRFLCQSLIEPTVPLNLSRATTLNSISTGCDPGQSFLFDLVISSLGCFGILSTLPREQHCGRQIQRERGSCPQFYHSYTHSFCKIQLPMDHQILHLIIAPLVQQPKYELTPNEHSMYIIFLWLLHLGRLWRFSQTLVQAGKGKNPSLL